MKFFHALTTVYREQPCQVLPNALWKTLARCQGATCTVVEHENLVKHLEIQGAEQLLLYWDRQRTGLILPWKTIKHCRLALIHDDYYDEGANIGFATHTPYFRLIHRHRACDDQTKDVRVRPVCMNTEADAITTFLMQCYEGISLTADDIVMWTHHDVYDPALWIWIDDTPGHAVGLGIAEFDPSIGEGSLEWIQVLPQYRRMGVGRELVRELLRRLAEWAMFTTVSGKVHSPSSPEQLYRRCGFEGTDVWWVMTRE